jgi:hypothetical protein
LVPKGKGTQAVSTNLGRQALVPLVKTRLRECPTRSPVSCGKNQPKVLNPSPLSIIPQTRPLRLPNIHGDRQSSKRLLGREGYGRVLPSTECRTEIPAKPYLIPTKEPSGISPLRPSSGAAKRPQRRTRRRRRRDPSPTQKPSLIRAPAAAKVSCWSFLPFASRASANVLTRTP